MHAEITNAKHETPKILWFMELINVNGGLRQFFFQKRNSKNHKLMRN